MEGLKGLEQQVSVTIVTYNSALYIGHCLEHLLRSEEEAFRVVVVDNASTDETRAILGEFARRIDIIHNAVNNGFAGGQNQAIGRTKTRWVLALNPDVRVTEGFMSRLLEAGESDERVGTVCGKLLGMSADFRTPAETGETALIDSTGIYFTPELRHFDRGSRTPDKGQFKQAEYVFGATGAAALYRREMIEDISIADNAGDSEFFDEDFFAYREDADVAWRAQLLGWKCLYTPSAVAFHVRSVLPSNRGSVSSVVNYHSVKNRFLMRIKNVDGTLYRRHGAAMTWRDALVLAGCLLRERSSLPAFWYVARRWRKTWQKRRAIMAKRRVSAKYMLQWFSARAVALPAVERRRLEGRS